MAGHKPVPVHVRRDPLFCTPRSSAATTFILFFLGTTHYAPRTLLSLPRRYDILAVDLDGTLLRRDGCVSRVSIDALARAREEGLRVVVCTGRGWVECKHILAAIRQQDPVVVAGGSIIAQPESGRTVHRFSMAHTLVRGAVDTLLAQRHAALVLKDPSEAGFDYLVVRGEHNVELDPVTRWWFGAMNVRVREAVHLDHDEHPEHTVRVGACAPASKLSSLTAALAASAGADGVVHDFPAVVAPDDACGTGTHDPMHVLELFDARATKWAGITHLAAAWDIAPERIAAIGDQINDLSMIKGAGLGIAMSNAIPALKDAAERHAPTNEEDGVAYAVERVLSGEW